MRAVTWKQLSSYGHTDSAIVSSQAANERAHVERRDATRWPDVRSIIQAERLGTLVLLRVPLRAPSYVTLRTTNGVAARSAASFHFDTSRLDLRTCHQKSRTLQKDKDRDLILFSHVLFVFSDFYMNHRNLPLISQTVIFPVDEISLFTHVSLSCKLVSFNLKNFHLCWNIYNKRNIFNWMCRRIKI